MIVEVVAVGTELLLGQIVNSNGAWLGERLAEEGFDAHYQTVVGDNPGRLTAAIATAIDRADAVILTGGLGPTQDDLTRESICAATHRDMIFDEEYAVALTAMWKNRFGREIPANNYQQADHPEGSELLDNPRGTAPGIALHHEGTWIFALPGVPVEMRGLYDNHVSPRLRDEAGGLGVLVSRTLHTFGIGESRVAEMMADLFETAINPSLAYLASAGITKIRLTAKGRSEQEAKKLIAPLEEEVRRRVGDRIFGVDRTSIEEELIKECRARGWTLAVAESVTGGAVLTRLTGPAGASDVVLGGVVPYATVAKVAIVGIDESLISEHGVVSVEVAEALAEHAASTFGADVGIGITGVAGPSPLAGIEPGTTIIGIRTPEGVRSRILTTSTDRAPARLYATSVALQLARLGVIGAWWSAE